VNCIAWGCDVYAELLYMILCYIGTCSVVMQVRICYCPVTLFVLVRGVFVRWLDGRVSH
jgi:hypothetical protein